jgi:hypothetical protein
LFYVEILEIISSSTTSVFVAKIRRLDTAEAVFRIRFQLINGSGSTVGNPDPDPGRIKLIPEKGKSFEISSL